MGCGEVRSVSEEIESCEEERGVSEEVRDGARRDVPKSMLLCMIER